MLQKIQKQKSIAGSANLTINLNELYEGGVFKTDAELENLIKLNGPINYQIRENTRSLAKKNEEKQNVQV